MKFSLVFHQEGNISSTKMPKQSRNLNSTTFFFFFFFKALLYALQGLLGSGTESSTLAVKAWSPNHWTTWELLGLTVSLRFLFLCVPTLAAGQ